MKKRKNQIKNGLLVIAVAAVLLLSVLWAGHWKGWFTTGGETAQVTVSSVTGSVLVQRSGVSYLTENGAPLQDGDVISAGIGGQLTLQWGESTVTCGETTAFALSLRDGLTIGLRYGQLFLCVRQGETITVSWEEQTQTCADGVFSLQTGENGFTCLELTGAFDPGALSDFALEQALRCDRIADKSLLEEEQACRQASWVQEIESQVNTGAAETPDAEGEIPEGPEPSGEEPALEGETSVSGQEAPASTSAQEETPEASTATGETGQSVSEQIPVPEQQPEIPAEQPAQPVEQGETCTISILCTTVLNNMALLDPALQGSIPSNGVILPETTVELQPGDTVFQVLQRVCSAAGVPLEYTYTPVFGSYYIEGINNLYQFSCGDQSGWMYKVNGISPSYGCSSYTLSDGDEIVWWYTCAYGND